MLLMRSLIATDLTGAKAPRAAKPPLRAQAEVLSLAKNLVKYFIKTKRLGETLCLRKNLKEPNRMSM